MSLLHEFDTFTAENLQLKIVNDIFIKVSVKFFCFIFSKKNFLFRDTLLYIHTPHTLLFQFEV